MQICWVFPAGASSLQPSQCILSDGCPHIAPFVENNMNSDVVPHEMLLKVFSRHHPGACAGTANEFATVRARREIGGIKKKKKEKGD